MAVSPADIARIALIRMAELSMPPTPENYARVFYEVSGTKPVETNPVTAPDPEWLGKVGQVMDDANAKTLALVHYLGGSNDTLAQSIEDIASVNARTEMMHALESLLQTTRDMHLTVESSRVELTEARLTLTRLQAEVESSHYDQEHDSITGAQNRLGMDKTLAKELKRVQDNNMKLSTALLSIDGFEESKRVYGIEGCDKLLQHLVTVGRSVMRDSDHMVRYGQEEFMLILPETDIKGAKFVLDRLQLIMQRSPLYINDEKHQMTFSAGIAQMNGHEQAHALVNRADRALFQAKSHGPNRIELAAAAIH